MLLFLVIPLTLVACTIVLGPVLAALLVRDAERVPADSRLPWGMGATDVPLVHTAREPWVPEVVAPFADRAA